MPTHLVTTYTHHTCIYDLLDGHNYDLYFVYLPRINRLFVLYWISCFSPRKRAMRNYFLKINITKLWLDVLGGWNCFPSFALQLISLFITELSRFFLEEDGMDLVSQRLNWREAHTGSSRSFISAINNSNFKKNLLRKKLFSMSLTIKNTFERPISPRLLSAIQLQTVEKPDSRCIY